MKYYVLGIWGDVEPQLSDEFDNPTDRDNKAKQWKFDYDEMDDGGIYRLNIDDAGNPSVDSYMGFELEPETLGDEE